MLLPRLTDRLLFVLFITVSWTVSQSQKVSSLPRTQPLSKILVRSHGEGIISPEFKSSDLTIGQQRDQSHAKSLKQSETTDAILDMNDLDNSILPRSRSGFRGRMSKSEVVQTNTEPIETEKLTPREGEVSLEDLNVEESLDEPIFYKDLPAPRRPEYGPLFLSPTTTATTSAGATSFVSTSFGVPPVVVDPNSTYQPNKKHKGPTSGYYPPIVRVMPRVDHMEAECSDDVMKLRVKFNASFSGLIYSAGYSYDTDCIYINGTGTDEYEFFIQLNRCGTLGGSDHNKKRDANFKNTDPTKNYMWNTVTIQYNPLIEEEWDEHFKVTCEYGYDFWKTVTFPFLDVEVNTADPVHFTLTPPECHMEIRNGYGTTGTKVTGPVHVGDPITLLILMRSQWDGFDIVVNDCFAHNGANKKIQLIDHHGCPVDDKLISKFQGTWGMANTMYETLIYAHMKTFRFTGTPALYIECDIRMCHGRCPTQSCNWRNSKAVSTTRRKRRSASDSVTADSIESDDEDLIGEEEGEITSEAQAMAMNKLNESLSDSINLFQAIHVLQSKEDEMALKKNETIQEPLLTGENTICVESMVLAAIIGSLSMVALLSSIIVTFLCMRLRKHKSSDTLDAGGTHRLRGNMSSISSSHQSNESVYSAECLRPRLTLKSEYVHSNQARIP